MTNSTFEFQPSMLFDEAIALLDVSRLVKIVRVLEKYGRGKDEYGVFPFDGERFREHSFLYGHVRIESLDGLYFTNAGRKNKWLETTSEGFKDTDPRASIWFHKCYGRDREGARRFLVSLGKICRRRVVTEDWQEPLTNPYAWSVQYTLGL